MPAPPPLLTRALRHCDEVLELTPAQWDRLIRHTRQAGLTGHLAGQLRDVHLLEAVPRAPRQHLLAALLLVDQQALAMRRELGRIAAALQGDGLSYAVLRGAAYLVAGLPHARGRLMGDLGLLVPRARIPQVQGQLMRHGWRPQAATVRDAGRAAHPDDDLLPLVHSRRGTVIQLHDTLLPEKTRLKLNSSTLFDDWQPLPEWPGAHVLPPADMLLHSVAQLLHRDEFQTALRELLDIDQMLRHFGRAPGFWPTLVSRAEWLRLQRPLFYALRYSRGLLHTPVPEDVVRSLDAHAPSPPALRWMDECWRLAVQPTLPDEDGRRRRLARAALYLRSQCLRLPPGAVLRQLLRVGWRQLQGQDPVPTEAQASIA